MLKLFSVRGIPVAAHWSLALAIALFAWQMGSLLGGVLLAVALFGSVLLHELGHSLVAVRLGLPIAGIDLHLFGGTAKMAAPPRSPREELLVAIAGPLVSLGLAASALALSAVVAGPVLTPVLSFLAFANGVLFLFNLLPALPMDGGRVLRALLASRKGFVDGTRTSVKVGRVVAVLMVVAGFAWNPWLLAIAAFVWMLGTAELRQADRFELLDSMGLRRMDAWAAYARSADGPAVVGAPSGAPHGAVVHPDLIVMPDGQALRRRP